MDNLEQQIEARLNELSDDELNKLAIHLKVPRAHKGIQAPLRVKISDLQRMNFVKWVKDTGNIQKAGIYLGIIGESALPKEELSKPKENNQEQLSDIIKALNELKEALAENTNLIRTQKAREAVKSAMSPLKDVYHYLRKSIPKDCDDYTAECIDNIKATAREHPKGYNALWDSLVAKPEFISDLMHLAETTDKRYIVTPTSQSDSILGDTWTILGIPINVKKLCTKLKSRPFCLICCLLVIVAIVTHPLWFSLTNKIGHDSDENTNISSETKTDKKIEDITLLYLFENDFNNLLRAGEDRFLSGKEGSQTIIKSKIYLDFETQTEFVGFYIPSVPETFDICTHLAENYKTALELTKKVMVESSSIGLQPVNTSELKFSGRVFIYHEYPLLEAQKRELFTLYKKHDLSPQFRGTTYLFKKKQIEKSQ